MEKQNTGMLIGAGLVLIGMLVGRYLMLDSINMVGTLQQQICPVCKEAEKPLVKPIKPWTPTSPISGTSREQE